MVGFGLLCAHVMVCNFKDPAGCVVIDLQCWRGPDGRLHHAQHRSGAHAL